MSSAITVESVAVEDLPQFVDDYLAHPEGQSISPLTRARARAHSENPHTRKGDIGLLVARSGARCVGHVSLFPGLLRTGGTTSRVVWSSGFFVSPEFRRGIAAFQLLRRLRSVKDDLVVTGFNPASHDICAAFGFRDFGPVTYLSVNVHPDLRGALRRRLLGRLDASSFRPPHSSTTPRRGRLLRLLARRDARHLRGVHWEEVEQVQAPKKTAAPSGGCFQRDAATVNWMLRFPWITEGNVATSPPYSFSDARDLARWLAVEVRDRHGVLLGFVVFSATIRHGKTLVKMLDYEVSHDSVLHVPFHLAVQYAARYRADRVILPLEMEPFLRGHPILSRLYSPRRRGYQYLSNSPDRTLERVLTAPEPFHLAYVDGDCAFA